MSPREELGEIIDALARQVALVEAAVAELAPGTPVHGALCFVDADLPPVGTLSLNGFPLLYPKRLAKRINRDGPLEPSRVRSLARDLAARFAPA